MWEQGAFCPSDFVGPVISFPRVGFDPTSAPDLRERRRGELDGRVESLLREMLVLHLLRLLALLLHHLLEGAHQLFGVAPKWKTEAASTFHEIYVSGPL